MKDRSGEEVRRYFGKALKICLHHEWTSFVMEMVSCVNNCPRLSLVNLITCLCWVTDQIIKKLGVSQSEIIFFWTPGCLLARRTSSPTCMPLAQHSCWGIWGIVGGIWSSTCVLRVWRYSRFSANLQQCLRSRVKIHRKRWKQLLIFVSSARGGKTAVCRAGKNTSSLSSVTHQLKNEHSPDVFFSSSSSAWANFGVIAEHFPNWK